MRYLITSLISLLFLTACQDKAYGTQDITNIPSITTSTKVSILSAIPKDKGSIAQSSFISLEFTSYMNTLSLNTSNISLEDEDGVIISINVSAKKNKLYVQPATSLTINKKYTLTLKSSIEDIMGNNLDHDYKGIFTCTSDFWSSVNAGSTHSMAQSKDGDIYVWGSNQKNQIVDINTTTLNTSIPLGIIGVDNAKSYSASFDSSAIILEDGSLLSVGENSLTDYASTTLSQISLGKNHSAFIKEDGSLWSWGKNDEGQLGNDGIFKSLSPVQEDSKSTNWKEVSASNNFSISLKTDGTLWGWGDNTFGQIGDTSSFQRRKPQQESSNATNWKEISAGAFHSSMIKTDGTLHSFGNNNFGQLGEGTNISSPSPQQEDTNSTNWISVSAGYSHTCAIKSDNTLWCWGENRFGQLGINNILSKNTPQQEDTNSTWKNVDAGKEFTLAVRTDGTLWAWGYNANKQLGLRDDTSDKLSPTEVK